MNTYTLNRSEITSFTDFALKSVQNFLVLHSVLHSFWRPTIVDITTFYSSIFAKCADVQNFTLKITFYRVFSIIYFYPIVLHICTLLLFLFFHKVEKVIRTTFVSLQRCKKWSKKVCRTLCRTLCTRREDFVKMN